MAASWPGWQGGRRLLLPALHRKGIRQLHPHDCAWDPEVGRRASSAGISELFRSDWWKRLFYCSFSLLCVFISSRCNLAGVMLQLMALGIPDVMNFDFMSKPSPGKKQLLSYSCSEICVFVVVFYAVDLLVSLCPCFTQRPSALLWTIWSCWELWRGRTGRFSSLLWAKGWPASLWNPDMPRCNVLFCSAAMNDYF